MSLQDLGVMLDYHYWACDRVLDAATALPAAQLTNDVRSSFKSVRATLAYLYFAEWIWYSRWQGNSLSKGREATEFTGVAALRQAWRELEGRCARS